MNRKEIIRNVVACGFMSAIVTSIAGAIVNAMLGDPIIHNLLLIAVGSFIACAFLTGRRILKNNEAIMKENKDSIRSTQYV